MALAALTVGLAMVEKVSNMKHEWHITNEGFGYGITVDTWPIGPGNFIGGFGFGGNTHSGWGIGGG